MPSDPERFWDERARENALFFVDSRLAHESPDEQAFWDGGPEALDILFGDVGFAPSRDDTVVEIGCGVGRLTRALAGRVGHVIGTDISSEMIKRAQEWNAEIDNIDWVHGDGQTLQPLDGGSVDGCLTHVVLQHIPDPEVIRGYLRDMGRVLRPGGWALFVLSTDSRVHRLSFGGRVKRLLGRDLSVAQEAAWRGSSLEVDDLRATLDSAELDIDQLLRPGEQFTTVLCRRRGG